MKYEILSLNFQDTKPDSSSSLDELSGMGKANGNGGGMARESIQDHEQSISTLTMGITSAQQSRISFRSSSC